MIARSKQGGFSHSRVFMCFGWSTALWVCLVCVCVLHTTQERVPQSVPRYDTMLGLFVFPHGVFVLCGFVSVRFSLEGRPEGKSAATADRVLSPLPVLQARTATFPVTFAAAHVAFCVCCGDKTN
jgi:hypothetical protein